MTDLLAGRELDALIAEKVMGLCNHWWSVDEQDDDNWSAKCDRCGEERSGNGTMLPPRNNAQRYYSTDIAAAWAVVEKIGESNDFYFEKEMADQWICNFFPKHITDGCFIGTGSARAPTAPLAICRAALKAVGT